MASPPIKIVVRSIHHDGKSLLTPLQDALDNAVRAYGVAHRNEDQPSDTEALAALRTCEDVLAHIEVQMDVVGRTYEIGQSSRGILELVRIGVLEPTQMLTEKCRGLQDALSRPEIKGQGLDSEELIAAASELQSFVEKLVDVGDRIIETRTEAVRLEREFCRALEDVRRKHLGVPYSRTGRFRSTIQANRGAVYLLFKELISNSFKYRAEDRELVISTADETADGSTRIKVSDNGIGMDQKECQSRIFKAGVRLDPAIELDKVRVVNALGQGLGLSIVKSISTYLSASIQVTSERGTGTTFYLSIPET